MSEHWLARPRTIRLLWRAFIVLLALVVLAEFAVEPKPHFTIEGLAGFGAWYGFLACAGMILFARLLGALLKRPESYYERGKGDD